MTPAAIRKLVSETSSYPVVAFSVNKRRKPYADMVCATIGADLPDGRKAAFTIALSGLEVALGDEPTQRMMITTRTKLAVQTMDRYVADYRP